MPHASTISLTVNFFHGRRFHALFHRIRKPVFHAVGIFSVCIAVTQIFHRYCSLFYHKSFPLSSLLLDRFCLFLSSSFCQNSLNLLYTDCLKNTRKKPARCMIWYRFFLLFYSFLFLDGRLLMIFPISRMSARNLILLSHRDQTVDILARKFPGTSE